MSRTPIKICKITATVSIVIGRVVKIYPIATAPVGAASSGAIPTNDGPTDAVIIDAWLGDVLLPANERPRVKVRLDAPGKPNHNRILVLPHIGLDDERAGCVQLRRSRSSNVVVGVYRASEAGLDTSGGAWVTVCEDHGALVNHDTRATAISFAPYPSNWCEDCRTPKGSPA